MTPEQITKITALIDFMRRKSSADNETYQNTINFVVLQLLEILAEGK